LVLYHIPRWNQSFDITIIRNGYLMVDLFFVLSGFVIYTAYSTEIDSRKDLLRFQFLRFGRLYPVHLFFLFVFLLIELAKYFAQLKFAISSPNSQPFRENNLTALIQQIFLVQAIGPTGNETTFNGPAWSISVEFCTYLVFGFVALYFARFKNCIFAAAFAISLLLLISKNAFGFDNLLHCYTGFFLGCIIAYAKENSQVLLPSYISLLAFMLVVFFLAFKLDRKYDIGIFFLAAFLIFALVSSGPGFLKAILNLRVLTWLGAISYSLYMSHMAVDWTVNQTLRVFLRRPEVYVDGISMPTLSFSETALAYILIVPTILVVSAGVYKYLEKPLRERSRRFAALHIVAR
jgi:peptidoglycan/LPS O-acetylase OafA/YrhL